MISYTLIENEFELEKFCAILRNTSILMIEFSLQKSPSNLTSLPFRTKSLGLAHSTLLNALR